MVAIKKKKKYIGLLIGSQAFQETPARHAPAIVLALLPNIASWTKNQIDNALDAAGTTPMAVGLDKLSGDGVLYHGLSVLGSGSTLGGMVLAAIAVFVIDRQFAKAAGFAAAGAVLTFFGLMHSEQIGFNQSPTVAIGYLGFAAVLMLGTKMAVSAATQPVHHASAMPLDEDLVAE